MDTNTDFDESLPCICCHRSGLPLFPYTQSVGGDFCRPCLHQLRDNGADVWDATFGALEAIGKSGHRAGLAAQAAEIAWASDVTRKAYRNYPFVTYPRLRG